MTITDADLDAWEKLANAATPGPWKTDVYYVVGEVIGGRPGGEVIIDCTPTVRRLQHDMTSRCANAEFVAMAREAMLRLIAELRAMRADGFPISMETEIGEKIQGRVVKADDK